MAGEKALICLGASLHEHNNKPIRRGEKQLKSLEM